MNAELRQEIDESRTLDAEQRVNVIRICAIALFYLVHLWHVSAPSLGEHLAAMIGFDPDQPVSPNLHISVTTLCLGWLMQAFAVHFFIQQKRVSDTLVAVSTIGDLAWLTAILCVSTGPAGPLVAGYFLILMMTGLRFNLRLVRLTTVGAVIGYLVLLGVAKWPIGKFKEIAPESVPRYHQLMIVLAIIVGGTVMGQIVRHAYTIADAVNRDDRGQQ